MNRMKGILGIKKTLTDCTDFTDENPEGWRPHQPKDPEGWRPRQPKRIGGLAPRQPKIELKCPENSGHKYKVSNILLFGYWKIFSWQ